MIATRLLAWAAALAGAITLCACSKEAATPVMETAASIAPVERAPEIIELNWDDLMPEGEEARLEELYAEFFADLDARMAEGSTMMTSRGPGSVDDIAEGSELDTMPQLGTFNTVPELDGRLVRLPGFIVPLDYEDRETVSEFLFVPYYGACIHTPPPPPNQIVYVIGKAKLRGDDLYRPYWAEGLLKGTPVDSALGDAAYMLVLDRLKPYDY